MNLPFSLRASCGWVLLCLIITTASPAQTTHIVNVRDDFYDPEEITIEEGNQIFLIAVGTVGGNQAPMDVFITSGGRWGDAFDPELVSETQWGTGIISGSDCETLHILLSPNELYQSTGYTELAYDLTRLTAPALPCPIDSAQ